MKYLVFIFGLILAIFRIWMGFNIDPEPFSLINAYKDIAHVFIGGLFVVAWIENYKWQWFLFWLLCIVEVITATLTRI